jgi:hypothetical protein
VYKEVNSAEIAKIANARNENTLTNGAVGTWQSATRPRPDTKPAGGFSEA